MEVKEQVKLRFLGVDFPSVQFTSVKQYLPDDGNPVSITIVPKAFLPKDRLHVFHVLMDVEVSLKEHFTLKILGIGYFEVASKIDVTDEMRKVFINANSTAIMFPYVRAFISTFTSNLGELMTPIILPTQFFKGDLEEYILPEDTTAEIPNT